MRAYTHALMRQSDTLYFTTQLATDCSCKHRYAAATLLILQSQIMQIIIIKIIIMIIIMIIIIIILVNLYSTVSHPGRVGNLALQASQASSKK